MFLIAPDRSFQRNGNESLQRFQHVYISDRMLIQGRDEQSSNNHVIEGWLVIVRSNPA